MKRFVSLFFIVFFMLFTSTVWGEVQTAPAWSYIKAGSAEEAGLNRSLALIPPPNPPIPEEEVKKLAADAGGLDKYPDANVVRLFSRDRTAFDGEGYFHLIQQEAIKILTNNAVKQYSSIDIGYSLPYRRIRILDAYIISKSGKITHIPEKDIIDVASSSGARSNIYEPIWRKKEILFPGVEPGTTIYYRFEECAVSPTMPGTLNWGQPFRLNNPLLSSSCCLKGPSDVPIHWYVSNDAAHKVVFKETSEDGFKKYCWTGGNLPMIVSEPGMIPLRELMSSLIVSNKTWSEYSKDESILVEPNLVPDEAIKNKVHSLIKGVNDNYEKERILFQYVTKKVRYMGVTFGKRPGFNPDPVSRTFANNAGVCKDKAGLLTAMLRIAGIDAYYTLNNPTCYIFKQVAVDQFNHAIVAARLPKEKNFRYLDVTSQFDMQMIPATSGGTGVLKIMPKGADIDTIPISSPNDNMGWINAETSFSEKGELISKINYHSLGYHDSMIRGALYYINISNHKEFIGGLLQKISSGAELKSFKFSPKPVDDLNHPVKIEIEYSIPKYLVKTGKYALFKIPGTLSALDWGYKDALRAASIPTRNYPVNLSATSGMTTTETVRIPSKYRIKELPTAINIKNDTINFVQKYISENNSVTLKQVFMLKKPRITPEEYSEFQKSLTTIKSATRAFVILEEK